MKFQCGRCGKNYLIDNADTAKASLSIPCDSCGNSFSIDENLSFSSASGNSKIICENCGQLVIETVEKCPACNLLLNKKHEAKRIDNKEYQKVILEDGKVVGKKKTGKRRGKGMLAALIIVLLAGAGGAFWFFCTQQHILKGTVLEPIAEKMPDLSGREESQVVIMMNGTSYNAEKIEKNGTVLRITVKNGAVVEVAEKDVLDITTAVIED